MIGCQARLSVCRRVLNARRTSLECRGRAPNRTDLVPHPGGGARYPEDQVEVYGRRFARPDSVAPGDMEPTCAAAALRRVVASRQVRVRPEIVRRHPRVYGP